MIEVEVWSVPEKEVGSFLAGIAPPLGLGSTQLADGSFVKGIRSGTYDRGGVGRYGKF